MFSQNLKSSYTVSQNNSLSSVKIGVSMLSSAGESSTIAKTFCICFLNILLTLLMQISLFFISVVGIKIVDRS